VLLTRFLIPMILMSMSCKARPPADNASEILGNDPLPGVLAIKLHPDVVEPSGLVVDGDALYTVSDRNHGLIFQLSKNGELEQTIDPGSGDFEGIAKSDSEFFLVRESRNTIEVYNRDFKLQRRSDLEHIADEHEIKGNAGFEGITYYKDAIYVTTEAKPQLMIKVTGNGSEPTWKLKGLGLDDISDVTYDSYLDCFWFLSHESAAIVRVNASQLAETRNLKPDYKATIKKLTGKKPEQAEGIAADEKYLYIVSDSDRRFFRIPKPTGPAPEAE